MISCKNKVILSGFVLSILVNSIIFFEEAVTPIGEFQITICIFMPFVIVLPMAFIMIFSKVVLREKIPFNKWDIEDARSILKRDDNLFKKSLARAYMGLFTPMHFIGGWEVGSWLFYNCVKKI